MFQQVLFPQKEYVWLITTEYMKKYIVLCNTTLYFELSFPKSFKGTGDTAVNNTCTERE
jgi:hypothetical protein